ncbi:hypothetical protein N7537_007504 [Penicillium hordei]|uniref:NACHT domain-containing protein n=1 Tax=Penicillium hordei TaxID=40994 RepID=A0AAD6DYK2_9EURO|nr:uncharacterized protein N7537_007504 [Penicillium hordei]KAJ5597420.1 hypothetical protein N7537_007504 [Penicillium hordei]
MDPLSLTTGIISLLVISNKVTQYISNLKDASEQRQKILNELLLMTGCLTILKVNAEKMELLPQAFLSLCGEDGILYQLKDCLQTLWDRLQPGVGFRRFTRRVRWPFRKDEVDDLLRTMERYKTILVLVLQSDNASLSTAIQENVTTLREEQERRRQSQQTLEILNWLSPLKSIGTHSDIFSRYHDGTLSWIQKDERYKAWLDGSSNSVWCFGIPGAGKTILASVIINDVSKKFPSHGLAYLYCNHKDTDTQNLVNLLGSLLQQLILKLGTAPQEVRSACELHSREMSRPTASEYLLLLQSLTSRFPGTFIVIDALDELSPSESTSQLLITMLQSLQPSTRLLVTSRPIPSTSRNLSDFAKIEIVAQRQDIARYVKGFMAQNARLTQILADDLEMRDDLAEKVVNNTQGMFLIAKLQMEALAQKSNRKAIRLAASTLPSTISDNYREAIERILSQDAEDAKLAREILSWVVCAVRPLTVSELQQALAVEPGKTSLDEEAVIDQDILISVCAGLLELEEEKGTVRLVHKTAQEYIDRMREEYFPDAQQKIQKTCLEYLSMEEFIHLCQSDEEFEARLQQYPLLDYASNHWPSHFSPTGINGEIRGLILSLLTDEARVRSIGQVLLAPTYRHHNYSQSTPRTLTGIHLLAYLGATEPLSLLKSQLPNIIDSKTDRGRTAISYAAERGHHLFIQELLRLSTVPFDLNSRDAVYGRTPLSWAAGEGQSAAAEVLIRAGADIECEDTDYGRSALNWAAGLGHLDTVRVLIRHGAEVDASSWYGRTSLSRAASRGHLELVRVLIEEFGASPHIQDTKYPYIPPSWSSWDSKDHDQRPTQDKLIDADSKAFDGGRPPLSWAAWGGDTAVISLLLFHGGDVNLRSENGLTPLSLAAGKGHVDAVRLLLEHGSPINVPCNWGRTPLIRAVINGHIDVVEVLRGHGADTEIQCMDGRTALWYAEDRGFAEIVQILRVAKEDASWVKAEAVEITVTET